MYLIWQLRVLMSRSKLSMASNSVVFLKTIAAKQAKFIVVPELAQIPSIYSMKLLPT